MAQAVFEEHPLDEYFQEFEEEFELMPGALSEFLFTMSGVDVDALAYHSIPSWVKEWCGSLAGFVEILFSFLPSTSRQHTTPFAERFKYDVISSSLLSSSFGTSVSASTSLSASLSKSQMNKRPFSPSFSLPGNLMSHHSLSSTGSMNAFPSQDDSVHERESERDLQETTYLYSYNQDSQPSAISWNLTVMIPIAIASLSMEWYLLSLLVVAGVIWSLWAAEEAPGEDLETKMILDSLKDLVSAGEVWNSMVQDAISIVEAGEQSIHLINYAHTASTPSSLKVALHSSLYTTRTQCDHVRQLLSALTAPNDLAQLSEMYAPPSPMREFFTSAASSPRPSALRSSFGQSQSRADTHTRKTSIGTKRSTWNGSYAALALAGSPSSSYSTIRRKEKRRSDLSAMLEATQGNRASMSAPATPSKLATLAGVEEEPMVEQEEEERERESENSEDEGEGEGNGFGAAALRLQRIRRSAGFEAMNLFSKRSSASPSFSASSAPFTPHHTRLSSSRFTSIQPRHSYHPLSLTSLHHAVRDTLSSKRYTCSHLLALRFEDEDDEAYWEDVRSVMGLLTSTFADAGARLGEAIEEAEKRRLGAEEEQTSASASVSESTSPPGSRGASPPPENLGATRPPKSMAQMLESGGFAPMPSHLARFAAHVDVMSMALSDARENLEMCVKALRSASGNEQQQQQEPSHPDPEQQQQPPRHPSLESYERLRRELGLALRECERGRERLLDIVLPPKPPLEAEAEADEPNDLPALGVDLGSDDSDKHEIPSPVMDVFRSGDLRLGLGLSPGIVEPEGPPDDATSHLLLSTSSMHLPPPGVEKVYEADTSQVVSFTRERSKFSREERIKLLKARRESSGNPFAINRMLPDLGDHSPTPAGRSRSASGMGVEKWGPGGDVVQELKDVIWKVGERRRKMAAGQRQVESGHVHETVSTKGTVNGFKPATNMPTTGTPSCPSIPPDIPHDTPLP